jgi:hypothetical protein
MRRRVPRYLPVLLAFFGIAVPAAQARFFGTTPLQISVDPSGAPADGPSGGPTVSGDNRRGRLAGFHSDATNLVPGDSNGATDVFVWTRPSGSRGLTLEPPARPAGALVRASVSSAEEQGNGASSSPSLDGSTTTSAHCVAFQSTATNLASGDTTPDSDVFVRDLRAGRTTLVSTGITNAANPSIDGRCRQVAFEAGGRVYSASATRGRPRSVGRGGNPDYSLDGTALVWEAGSAIMVRRGGRTNRVATGDNPTVSDSDARRWGVSYDNSSGCFLKVLGRRGGGGRTQRVNVVRNNRGALPGRCLNGGVTAFAPTRGIVVFAMNNGGSSTAYYWNKNSGNTDDLSDPGAAITEMATGARANFVAWTQNGQVFFKHLSDGQAL